MRGFIKGLGKNYLYAYDMKVIGVFVNDRSLWPSARLKQVDKVVILPVVSGD